MTDNSEILTAHSFLVALIYTDVSAGFTTLSLVWSCVSQPDSLGVLLHLHSSLEDEFSCAAMVAENPHSHSFHGTV